MPAMNGVGSSDIYAEGGELGFLLVHRIGGTPADLSFLAQRLAAAGHTVLCPLLFGHGGSRTMLGATTWRQWYAGITAAHEDLSAQCDHVVVGGLSAGAALALMLAADHPSRIGGVVLYAPTFSPRSWARLWYGPLLCRLGHKGLANLFGAQEVAPYGIKDDKLRRLSLERIDAQGRTRADAFGRPGGVMLELHWLAAATRARLSKTSQPALIFHAREDDREDGSVSYWLQAKLGGITDVVVLEDSFHLVTVDRQRELVLERTLEFASKVQAGPLPPPLESDVRP